MAAPKKIITDQDKIARFDAARVKAEGWNKLKQMCSKWVRDNHPEVWKRFRQECGLD